MESASDVDIAEVAYRVAGIADNGRYEGGKEKRNRESDVLEGHGAWRERTATD